MTQSFQMYDAPAVAVAPAGEVENAVAPDEKGGMVSHACTVIMLDTIPGMDERGAGVLVMEWGIDMTRFNTVTRLLGAEAGAHRRCSLAAVSPYDLLLRRGPSQELGANHLTAQHRHDLADRFLRRLAYLDYHVHLEPLPVTASYDFFKAIRPEQLWLK